MPLPLELLQRFEPFSWGERDCVHFAAGARAYFGAPPVDLPVYASQHDALTIIASYGGLRQMLVDRLGEPLHPSQAQIGDTVYATFASIGEIVGVADPPGFWLLTQTGFLPVPMTAAIGVWRCRP